MKSVDSVADLPGVPAVYALYGGRDSQPHVAYVGQTTKLKGRVMQHLVQRDSSVTTGTAAVGLRPEHVTEIRWWEHESFDNRERRAAAELVAGEILEPILKSRGGAGDGTRALAIDPLFRREMKGLFTGQATGRLIVQSLDDALRRISELESRVAELERLVTESRKSS